jgi:hypothetical protein
MPIRRRRIAENSASNIGNLPALVLTKVVSDWFINDDTLTTPDGYMTYSAPNYSIDDAALSGLEIVNIGLRYFIVQ